MKTLKQNVHVHDPETGRAGWFGPSYESAELPDWAAELVTNPDVFEDAGAAELEPLPPHGLVTNDPDQGLTQDQVRTVTRTRSDAAASAQVSQPRKSASRADWEAYATSPAVGMSAEEAAEFSNKDELIAAVTGEEE